MGDVWLFVSAPAALCAGFTFYGWRYRISLRKQHNSFFDDKRHSFTKLWYGFLFMAGMPAIMSLAMALFWQWRWDIPNLAFAIFGGFVLGGILRAYFEEHWGRERSAPDEDDERRGAA